MSKDSDAAEIVRRAMSDLVDNFATPTDLPAILELVTSHSVLLIDNVDFADVLLVDHSEYRSMAPTEDLATQLDKLQLELVEGPCLSAAAHDATVVCSNLNADSRWPRFADAAVQAGVQSMMSFHLYTTPSKTTGGAGGRGALNLFSRNQYDFNVQDQAIGAMLATYAATALIAADRQTQFESALASRDLLGQAKGILMERFKVDAVRAFGLMTKLSQDTNTPARVIAQRIVDTLD